MKKELRGGRMSRKMIAIAHSLSEGNMLCDTRVEVLLLGRGRGCDREFSGVACASMHQVFVVAAVRSRRI